MTTRKLPAHIRAGLPGNVISFCIVPLLSRHRREGARSGQIPNKFPCLPPGRKGGAAVQSQTMTPDGGEELFLFQKAKFIRYLEFGNTSAL